MFLYKPGLISTSTFYFLHFVILAFYVEGVVLGEQNTNLKPNNSKTTQVNSSSAMATSKDNEKSSESSVKATRDKPPLGAYFIVITDRLEPY